MSAFVADVPNNVLSVGSLLRKDWSLSSSGSELEALWRIQSGYGDAAECAMDFSRS